MVVYLPNSMLKALRLQDFEEEADKQQRAFNPTPPAPEPTPEPVKPAPAPAFQLPSWGELQIGAGQAAQQVTGAAQQAGETVKEAAGAFKLPEWDSFKLGGPSNAEQIQQNAGPAGSIVLPEWSTIAFPDAEGTVDPGLSSPGTQTAGAGASSSQAPAVGDVERGGDLRAYARQAAQRAGIDPDIFERQIQQESGFDPTAGSPAGAQGIAQIMPNFHPGVDTSDPYASLDYAANLMKSHLGTYGGDIRKALQAYNAGPGNVASGAADTFAETKDYLAKILSGAGEAIGGAVQGAGRALGITPQPTADLTPDQSTLDDPDKWALCGPVAAMAFARANGREPTIAEAKQLAIESGWTAGAGMAGLGSEVALLGKLGVAAKTGSADQETISADVRNGNPVIISTPNHYFVAERVDDQGRFYVGNSGTVYRGGSKWMTLDQISALGGGIQGAAYMDNPTSPTPSVAVAATEPALSSPTSAAGQSEPAPGLMSLPDKGIGLPAMQAFEPGTSERGPFDPPNYEADSTHGPFDPPGYADPPVLGPAQPPDDRGLPGQISAAAGRVARGELGTAIRDRIGQLGQDINTAAQPTPEEAGAREAVLARTEAANIPEAAKVALRGMQSVDDMVVYLNKLMASAVYLPIRDTIVKPLLETIKAEHHVDVPGIGEIGTADVVTGLIPGVGATGGGARAGAFGTRVQNPSETVLGKPIAAAADAVMGSEPVRRAGELIGGLRDSATAMTRGLPGGAPVSNVVPEGGTLGRMVDDVPAPVNPALAEITRIVEEHPSTRAVMDAISRDDFSGAESVGVRKLFVRYADQAPSGGQTSTDWQTGQKLAGVSANPLTPRADYPTNGRTVQDWVAMQIRDYSYMQQQGRPGTKGWVFEGIEVGKGPDGEPLVKPLKIVAEIPQEAIQGASASRPAQRPTGPPRVLSRAEMDNPTSAPGAATNTGAAPGASPDPTLAAEADRFSAGQQQAGRGSGLGVVPESDRYYHGTGAAFDTPNPATFDENGLFGPGYYLTSDPRVAESYTTAQATGPFARNIPSMREAIARTEAALATATPAERPALESRLADYQDRLGEIIGDSGRTPNVRAVDVPRGLRLLDAEGRPTPDEITRIVDAANELTGYGLGSASATVRQIEQRLNGGRPIYDVLRDTVGDTPLVNESLAAAGYDGVRYDGGKRIPMSDADGSPIEHQATMIFGDSLPKITNATSGLKGGIVAGDLSGALGGTGQGAIGGAVAGGYEESQREGATPGDVLKGIGGGAVLGAARQRLGQKAIGRAAPGQVARAVVQAGDELPPIYGPRSVTGADMAATRAAVRAVPVSEVQVDPERFQFKFEQVNPETGTTNKLNDVRRWNPEMGGAMYGWEDEAGQVFVVNGHHRIELAKRLGAQDVNMFIDRAADGVTADQAMVKGVLINIAEGNGTPLDVAKFLRNSGQTIDDLKMHGVSGRSRLATRGAALAELDDGLFQRVINGQLPEDSAVVIGQNLPGDPANQRAVADIVQARPLKNNELQALIDEARGETVTMQQDTLFGTTEIEQSTLVERARLRADVQDSIAKDRRLFGFVARADRAAQLSRGENVINVEASVKIADESARAGEYFRALANAPGPVSDAIREGAESLVRGEKYADIQSATLDRVRAAITDEASGSPRPASTRVAPENPVAERPPARADEPAPAVEPVQTGPDLFGSEPLPGETPPLPRAIPEEASGTRLVEAAQAVLDEAPRRSRQDTPTTAGPDPVALARAIQSAAKQHLPGMEPAPSLPTSPRPGPNTPGEVAALGRATATEAKQEKATALDWVKSVGYSAMIGPTAGLVNTVGAVMDFTWQIPKSATMAVTRGHPKEFAAELQSLASAPMQAGAAVLDVIRKGSADIQVRQYQTLSEKLESPIWKAVATTLEAGGRVWSQSPDAFFGTFADAMGTAGAAGRIASKEGLEGKAWWARVEALKQDVADVKAGELPRFPEAVEQVQKEAQALVDRLTYKGKMGETGQKLSDLMKVKGPGGSVEMLSHLVMPFFPTLYHLHSRLLEKTPLGVLADQPKAEKIYDVAMGSLVFSGLVGTAMAQNITGSGPDDPAQKQMMRDQGWRPNSTRVGPYYIPNRLFGSFGPMFNSAGEVADTLRYGKAGDDAYKVSVGAVKRLGNVVTDQFYFAGLSDALKMMEEPEKILQTYLTSQVRRGIPYAATLQTAASAMDPAAARRPERAADIGLRESIGEGLKTNIPGLRQQVPATQNTLGEVEPNTRMGAGALLPAYGTTTFKPILKAYQDAGIGIGLPPKQVTHQGKQVALTPKEQRAYQQVMGRELQFNALDAMAEADPVNRVKKLERALERARATAAREAIDSGVGLRAEMAGASR